VSICVSVKVGEGVVIAADSAITVAQPLSPQQPDRMAVHQVYEHGNKIFQVGDYPIGVATWGVGSLGGRSVASLLGEFSDNEPLKASWSVDDVADRVYKFVTHRYREAFQGAVEVPSERGPALGLLVVGAGPKGYDVEQYVGLLPLEPEPGPARKEGIPPYGANWYGQTDAILRLYKGFDPQIDARLQKAGLTPQQIRGVLDGLEYPAAYDHMPIQDAIDLALYLVGVVVGRFRFVVGPALCGGDIDVAVVSARPRQFQWVRRKEWRARPIWSA